MYPAIPFWEDDPFGSHESHFLSLKAFPAQISVDPVAYSFSIVS
jgi:hypothetical protein